MKAPIVSRSIAVLLMGLFATLFTEHTYISWQRRGREAFLTHQTQRFDHYMIAPHITLGMVLANIITVVLVAGVYELVATGIGRIFRQNRSSSSNH